MFASVFIAKSVSFLALGQAALFVSAESTATQDNYQPSWLENLQKVSDVLVKENLHGAETDPADDDQCHQTYKDEDSCNADASGVHPTGCTWCHCRALPSSCWTMENSKKLPAAVFKCDKSLDKSLGVAEEPQEQQAAVATPDDKMYI